MKNNRNIITAIVVLLLLVGVACSRQAPTGDTSTQADTPQLELTLEELAEYNGKDGSPAYIAIDGIIYDVSGSSRWKDGEHNGYSAGQDLTEAIKGKSPHGASVLTRMPVVGKIIE